MAFEINFTLKTLENIDKFGSDGKYSLHFFAISDSIYTYKIGNTVLLEYKDGHINDYYLERFVQDFLEIFPFFSRSVSEEFYQAIKNKSYDFETELEQLIIKYIDSDDEKIVDELCDLTWYISGCRQLGHGHLRDYLNIYFYRFEERLLIKWECSENYKAQSGQTEVLWNDFISDIQCFAKKYISEMTLQCERLSRFSAKDIKVYDPFPYLEDRKNELENYIFNNTWKFSEYSEGFLQAENDFKYVHKILDKY